LQAITNKDVARITAPLLHHRQNPLLTEQHFAQQLRGKYQYRQWEELVFAVQTIKAQWEK
jgi:hypothetical protein